ncbi:probable phenylalanine--tRNA ligase, mitochondrial [Onthophagus taurus]|uniref:probable phenylalanine--tRNA ligase, mitochondrial n=1 Tax=Onthophagus taurus TaxID=166361 RepID=UPI0039BDCBF2
MLEIRYILKIYPKRNNIRLLSSVAKPNVKTDLVINNVSFKNDDFTNITPKILSHIGKNIHTQKYHPLSMVRQRIVNYFYKRFVTNRGNPIFSMHENISPIVTTDQNFDSLLIPKDHPSRSKSDCYYLNKDYLLRAHTTAHQSELIQSGLNAFLVIGDVYRRDEIDRTHYPVFHQVDGVLLKTRDKVFPQDESLSLFEKGNNTNGIRSQPKQACHTLEAVKVMEHDLKSTLEGLAKELFGNVKQRWVETYFPFTDPSWELEVWHKEQWMEILGCGIMKQNILSNSGVNDRIGWAFGLGLERIAMCLYNIPDIRLFWSEDSGFLNQFKTDDIYKQIEYKAISQFPQCNNDISFWLPDGYSSNDFYDLVRNIGGDMIEQVSLIDEFKHPKSGKISHCYKITYRHMAKTLSQDEVNIIHKEIEKSASEQLNVKIR